MIITTDSEQIFEFLGEIHRAPRDYASDDLLALEHEHNFHLVIYRAAGDEKGFTMYSVTDFQNNPSTLQLLLDHLQDETESILPPTLKPRALREVESRIHARPGSTLFYDAH